MFAHTLGVNMGLEIIVALLIIRMRMRRWFWCKVHAIDAWLCWTVCKLFSSPFIETGVVTAKIQKGRRHKVIIHVPVFRSYSQAVEARVSRKQFCLLSKGSEVTVKHRYDLYADRYRGKIISVSSYAPVPDWESRKKGMPKKRKSEESEMFFL